MAVVVLRILYNADVPKTFRGKASAGVFEFDEGEGSDSFEAVADADVHVDGVEVFPPDFLFRFLC
jgi:hypothetical protein